MLFVSISDPKNLLAADFSQADGVELRLDLFNSFNISEIREFIQNSRLPTLVTLRRKDQGGEFSGAEGERLAKLEELCALQPALVDLEWDVPLSFRKKLFEAFPKIQFISSFHDFTKMPDLRAILPKMVNPYTHIYKIAGMAHSTLEALELLLFVQDQSRAGIKMIGIAMGERGVISRILGPIFGSILTYCFLGDTKTAPGQLTPQELEQIYHYRSLNKESSIYGLIGNPVDKSAGHRVHNAVMEKLKINAVYVKMALEKEELPAFFALIKQMPFKGLSVTMPFKEAILPFLKKQSQEVTKIGASNTLLFQEGELFGFNTDGIGAIDAIEAKMGGPLTGKKVVLLGAGGACKAIAFEAIKRGSQVFIINRTASKAQELASSLGCQGGGVDLLPEICKTGYAVLINGTPEGSPIDPAYILPGCSVMDSVYVPKETPFLLTAAQKNCQLIYGYEMFINQAVEQCLIWYGKGVDSHTIKTTIEKLL